MNKRQRSRILVAVTALTAALLVTSGGGIAQAAASWQDNAGPAIAKAPPPRAPQLENTGIWQAKPTQVCMSSAYRAGEFLYQGCVWDDQGGGVPQEWPLHTMLKAYTYPTDPAYRVNAADRVELRTKPVAGATAFRLTYNTMTDPELVATTIALGTSAAPVAMPFGANTVTPAQVFGDHAYWLSGIETRDGLGTVDVFSHGFGVADPAVPGVRTQLGVSTGTVVPLNAYTMESRALPAPATAPVANRLDVNATNISSVTIDPAQAKVDCAATLNVTTDGPVRVTLLGCGTRTFGQE